jgi:hypothetical protein
MADPPLKVRSPRFDGHNASIDPRLASRGHCGMTHLATGRLCARPARHEGSCEFVTRDDAEARIALRPFSSEVGRSAAGAGRARSRS